MHDPEDSQCRICWQHYSICDMLAPANAVCKFCWEEISFKREGLGNDEEEEKEKMEKGKPYQETIDIVNRYLSTTSKEIDKVLEIKEGDEDEMDDDVGVLAGGRLPFPFVKEGECECCGQVSETKNMVDGICDKCFKDIEMLHKQDLLKNGPGPLPRKSVENCPPPP